MARFKAVFARFLLGKHPIYVTPVAELTIQGQFTYFGDIALLKTQKVRTKERF